MRLGLAFPRLDRKNVALWAIILTGLVLRLVFYNGLNWDDDPDYVSRAYGVMKGIGLFAQNDNNGYRTGTYIPAAIPYLIFGVNNFSCGFYALIVSMISLPVIYKLGTLLFNARTGLIAALLLAFYPLDIEFASRLMPDGLLSGFSLFAMHYLFKGDVQNFDGPGTSLRSAPSYLISGLFLGWCTMVNMSAVVIVLFVAIYFFLSLPMFLERLKKIGFLRGFLKIILLRYAILLGGFILIAIIEGFCYYKGTGDFFLKYRGTLSHYSNSYGFCTDLFMFPSIMFHINNSWKPAFMGKETSYYGFYYLAALPALVWGLWQRRRNFYIPILWLTIVFSYLEWGSMSFTHYAPMHRLPRHLCIATPPMILCLAAFLGNFKPEKLRAWIAPLILLFLTASSAILAYYRHQDLEDAVLPQVAVHNYLESLKSELPVYLDARTTGYHRFLRQFRPDQTNYLDFNAIKAFPRQEGYAVIGEFRNWEDTTRNALPTPGVIPEDWKLVATLAVEGRLRRPPHQVRIYKVPQSLTPQPMESADSLLRSIRGTHPDLFQHGWRLLLHWRGLVDGADEVLLHGSTVALKHLQFNPPQNVVHNVLMPVPQTGSWRYRVVKRLGRSEIRIIEPPTGKNGFVLRILIDDGAFPSTDLIEFAVFARRQ